MQIFKLISIRITQSQNRSVTFAKKKPTEIASIINRRLSHITRPQHLRSPDHHRPSSSAQGYSRCPRNGELLTQCRAGSGQRSSRPGSRSIWPLIVYSAHPDEHPLCARWMAKKCIDFPKKVLLCVRKHLRDERACCACVSHTMAPQNSRIVPMCELCCVLFEVLLIVFSKRRWTCR